jgi:hypothetical protein
LAVLPVERPGFDPLSGNVGFFMDKMALERFAISLPISVLPAFPVSLIVIIIIIPRQVLRVYNSIFLSILRTP